MIGNQATTGVIRDPRHPSVRFQDAAILEYAVRNRLHRGKTPEEPCGDERAPGAHLAGRMRRTPRKRSAWASARAEGIYRGIAPPNQKYPLRAVVLVRRLLAEGAPDLFVREKYRTHVQNCEEIGVLPMPLIPYLTELLEILRLETNTARRNATLREYSKP